LAAQVVVPGFDPGVTVTKVPLKMEAESITEPLEVCEERDVTKERGMDVTSWGGSRPRTSIVREVEGVAKAVKPLTTTEFPVSAQSTVFPVTGVSPPARHRLQVPVLLQFTSNVMEIVPPVGMP